MTLDSANSALSLIASTEFASEPSIMPPRRSSLSGMIADEAPASLPSTIGSGADGRLTLRAARSWSLTRCAPEQQRLGPWGQSLRRSVLQSGRRFLGAARRSSSEGQMEWSHSRTLAPVFPDKEDDADDEEDDQGSSQLMRLYEDAIFDMGSHPPVSDTVSEVLFSGSPSVSDRGTPKFSPLNTSSPPGPLAVTRLPPEIIQQIYEYLGPADFNSARHTCQKWLYVSVQKSLLHTMLKRGGWWSGVDVGPHPLPHSHDTQLSPRETAKVSEEWWLSKCISRECSLGPDWMGDGVQGPTLSSPEPNPAGTSSSRRRSTRSTSLEMTSVTDFSEMIPEYNKDDKVVGSGVYFTVSVCGRYVMVCEDCTVYIYCLSGQNHQGAVNPSSLNSGLSPVTSVICPRRVLAVSMDTSCERYAIVALLAGRMGLVCELGEGGDDTDEDAAGHFQHSEATPDPSSSHSPPRFNVTSFRGVNDQFTEPALAEVSELERSSRVWASSSGEQKRLGIPAVSEGEREADVGKDWIATHTGNQTIMPVDTGPSTIYRDICSMNDPPRSVAICPQRKCVAFGCYAGIELHWVDGKTGQDLNRWFPLSTPSDFLYFLPPRAGVDSARKLRIISSAARPGDTAALSHRLNTSKTASSPFRNMYFHRLPTGTPSPTNDHYRAVPLSDGYHILFMDPPTGQLCLGSDAPIGGPTKLLRKIILPGPKGVSPTMYASGADLRWGARVVAVFGEVVVLFCVPPDVLLEGVEEGRRKLNAEWKGGWVGRGEEDGEDVGGVIEGRETGPWPLVIRGAEVGRVEGLVDVGVESGGSLIVWTFERQGLVRKWEVVRAGGGEAGRMRVLREGGVVGVGFEGKEGGETVVV